MRTGRVLEACSESLRNEPTKEAPCWKAGEETEPTCTSVIRPRLERGTEGTKLESGFEAGRPERRRRTFGRSLLTPTAQHVMIRLWNSDLDWGLVWRTGQAGIRVLNPGERSAISHHRR